MLPKTSFLQLIPARVKAAINRIENRIWLPSEELAVGWIGSGREHIPIQEARQRKITPIKGPFFWGELEDQAWFRVEVPEKHCDGTWFLEWKEQGESTAYVRDLPFAGLDVGHLRCPIPKDCPEIWVEVMALETGIWVPGHTGRAAITKEGCRFETARARQRDDLAWEVYHDFQVLFDLLQSEYERQPGLRTPFGAAVGYSSPLEDVSVLYRRLARLLDRVVCAYERDGLPGAKEALNEAYKKLRGQAEPIRCRLSGHAHIDLVWLWTEKAGEFKAVHSFATMNRLLDRYPELRFGYSQPASYRAVEGRSPELMQSVREHIANGRWEAVGAAEVECDNQIACGEALVRCLTIGQEGFRKLQGQPSRVMWLPDVFGYTACLPQILRETGVDYFFTTKLHWGSIELFPYSSFIWEGADGSRILSHVSQGMGYNMNVLPSEIRKATREYRQSDVHDEILMCCGYGDGGGGVTEEMCERARRIEDLSGTARSSWGRIDEYFEGLEAVRDDLPIYTGELYLQYHRGALTTRGDLKAAFRRAERSLQTLEAIHAVLGLGPIEEEYWQRMVFAQFHDYIPGSSIAAVYEEALPELQRMAEKAERAAIQILSSESGEDCLFNPLPLSRTVRYKDQLVRIGPLEGKPIAELETTQTSPVEASARCLSSDRVRVEFDPAGRIATLTVDEKSVATDSALGGLVHYPDQPHAFEAWDIDRSTLSLGEAVGDYEFVRAKGSAVSGTVVFRANIAKHSRAEIQYRLTAGSPTLDIEYRIDWQDRERLLKVLFPTRYRGSHARYGAPFGSIRRSQQPGRPYDEAQWEVPGSRWAMVADDGETDGLFVVTESKYGWSARNGVLGLSLLRSPLIPTGGGGADPVPGAPCSDLGEHRIKISLGCFDPQSPPEETPAALADSLYLDCIPYRGAPCIGPIRTIENASSLLPCWIKPESDGGSTIRLHETLGRRGEAEPQFADGTQTIEVNMSGEKLDESELGQSKITFEPYQVRSIKVRPTHNS